MVIRDILMNIWNHLNKRTLSCVALLLLGMASALASCTFVGKPPVAVAEATPLVGEAPVSIVFDGSPSFDSDGVIVSYSWDFDDGSANAQGQTTSHKFEEEGVFTVILTVTDDHGNKDSDKVFITAGQPRIYFSSNRRTGTNYEIFRMDIDGSNETQVTVASTPLDDVLPKLLPNTRGKLAFSSDRDSPGILDIFTANPDGTLLSNLTPTQTTTHEIEPFWSPDGTQIAYASNDTQSGSFEIFLMDSDGTNSKQLTKTTSAGMAVAPAISPSGTRLVFSANCNGITVSSGKASMSSCGTDFELFVATLNAASDVTAVAKLTSNTTNDGAVGPDLGPAGLGVTTGNLGFGSSTLSWSPDGTKIAYTAHPGVTADIYICDFNAASNACTTTAPLPNASDSGFEEYSPYWFTEAGVDRIAFVTNRPSGGTVREIWKVKADGTGLVKLTSLGANVQPAGAVEPKRR